VCQQWRLLHLFLSLWLQAGRWQNVLCSR
jgi:hypothetical protein